MHTRSPFGVRLFGVRFTRVIVHFLLRNNKCFSRFLTRALVYGVAIISI